MFRGEWPVLHHDLGFRDLPRVGVPGLVFRPGLSAVLLFLT